MADFLWTRSRCDVISGGVIEVNKWGVHTKFRGSSSTRSWDLEPSSNLQHLLWQYQLVFLKAKMKPKLTCHVMVDLFTARRSVDSRAGIVIANVPGGRAETKMCRLTQGHQNWHRGSTQHHLQFYRKWCHYLLPVGCNPPFCKCCKFQLGSKSHERAELEPRNLVWTLHLFTSMQPPEITSPTTSGPQEVRHFLH